MNFSNCEEDFNFYCVIFNLGTNHCSRNKGQIIMSCTHNSLYGLVTDWIGATVPASKDRHILPSSRWSWIAFPPMLFTSWKVLSFTEWEECFGHSCISSPPRVVSALWPVSWWLGCRNPCFWLFPVEFMNLTVLEDAVLYRVPFGRQGAHLHLR